MLRRETRGAKRERKKESDTVTLVLNLKLWNAGRHCAVGRLTETRTRTTHSRRPVSPDVPQPQIQGAELRQLHDPLQADGADPRTAVQVYAAQVSEALGDGLQALVRDSATLPDVERLQVVQRPRDAADPIVRYLARAEGQGSQVEQALRHVHQGLVADLVAERHVQGGYPRPALREVRHANVRYVIARPQVQFAERHHLSQVLKSTVGYAYTETKIDALEAREADGHVLEGLVRQPLAVLQAKVLERQVAVRRFAVQAGQVADSLVRHVPAGPQVEASQVLQPPRDKQQTRVGHVATAAEFQHLEVLEELRDASETGVRHLLAQRQVQLSQHRHVRHEGVRQTDVRHVVAPAEVQGLQVRDALHHVPETASQGQNLDPPDAASHEGQEQGRVGSPQVQLGFDAAPHGLVVRRVSPRDAHLRRSSLVAHLQVAEDEGQDLGV